MTKINQAAELGEQFLLDNYEKCRLEVEYDFDGERIFIQLTDKDSGTCTVFDGSDIFRQVHEFISRTQEKHYRLTLNGQDFTGTAEDVARWYCKQKGIKLYIEPREDNGIPALFTWGRKPLDYSTPDYVDMFKEKIPGFEDGYRLFFTESMLTDDEPDFTITELS